MHFVRLDFQHMKIKNKNMIINIFSRVSRFVCLPIQNMPSSGFLMACGGLATSRCPSVGFCIALCVVSALNSQGLYFHCIVLSVCHFLSGSLVEILFRLFSLGAKWNGKEVKILRLFKKILILKNKNKVYSYPVFEWKQVCKEWNWCTWADLH